MIFDLIYMLLCDFKVVEEDDPRGSGSKVRSKMLQQDAAFLILFWGTVILTMLGILCALAFSWWYKWLPAIFVLILVPSAIQLWKRRVLLIPKNSAAVRAFISGVNRYFEEASLFFEPSITNVVIVPFDIQTLGNQITPNVIITLRGRDGTARPAVAKFRLQWTFQLDRNRFQLVLLNFYDDLRKLHLESFTEKEIDKKLAHCMEAVAAKIRETVKALVESNIDAFFAEGDRKEMTVAGFTDKLVRLNADLNTFFQEHIGDKIGARFISTQIDDPSGDWVTEDTRATTAEVKSQADQRVTAATRDATLVQTEANRTTAVAQLQADKEVAEQQKLTGAAQIEAAAIVAEIDFQPVLKKLELIKGKEGQVLILQLQQMDPPQLTAFAASLTDALKSQLTSFVNVGSGTTGDIANVHPVVALLQRALDAFLKKP